MVVPALPNHLMGVNDMAVPQEDIEKFERKSDWLINFLFRAGLIFVVFFVSAVIIAVIVTLFGAEPKDRDVVEWCEEYQPTWTYEQCEKMVGY